MKTYPSRLGGPCTCLVHLSTSRLRKRYLCRSPSASGPTQPSHGGRLISSDYLPIPYCCSWIEHSRPLDSLFPSSMYRILVQYLHAANLIILFDDLVSHLLSPLFLATFFPLKTHNETTKTCRKSTQQKISRSSFHHFFSDFRRYTFLSA